MQKAISAHLYSTRTICITFMNGLQQPKKINTNYFSTVQTIFGHWRLANLVKAIIRPTKSPYYSCITELLLDFSCPCFLKKFYELLFKWGC